MNLKNLGGTGAELANIPFTAFKAMFKQVVVAADGAAGAVLTATGINPGDHIIGVIGYESPAISPYSGPAPVTVLDRTAATTIVGKNQISVSVATTDETLVVTFLDLTQ